MSKILELRTKRNTLWEQTKDFLEKNPGAKIYYATTKAPQTLLMFIMKKTATLCLEKRAQESRRTFWSIIRKPV